MEKNAKIYVAGHRGLVGSAIWKNLQDKGYTNLVGRTHKELDLLDGMAVRNFFDEEQPEYVFLAAAFVGGIMANSIYRADFIYKNLQIQQNIIGESFRHHVKKLLFLGSTFVFFPPGAHPADERRCIAYFTVRIYQRAVCNRQNCRTENVRELQPAIWNELHRCDADKPLRTE